MTRNRIEALEAARLMLRRAYGCESHDEHVWGFRARQVARLFTSSGAASPARRDGSIVAANGDPGEANT